MSLLNTTTNQDKHQQTQQQPPISPIHHHHRTGVPPKCVILGAGYAGALFAKELEPFVKAKKLSLTVVERRDGVHLKIGAIRASVRGGEWIDRVRVPLNRVVRNAKTVIGNVSKVSPHEQKLYFEPDANGDVVEPVSYDILICATGTHNDSPGDLPPTANTKDSVRSFLRGVSGAIREARDVIVCGGGASAVEFASEIRDVYRDKPITIVSSAEHLLTTCVAPLKPHFFRKLYHKLEQHNINVIRGEKVIYPTISDFDEKLKIVKGPVEVRTIGKQNLTLRADLVIWAATWKVNTSIYPSSWLNDQGELFVSDTFQVLDDPRVFAIGDVSSIIETKQAITLPPKIRFLRKNVIKMCDALMKGQTPQQCNLGRYRTNDLAVMHLPVTSTDGVSQWYGMVFGGTTTSRWKGKDLYTDQWWKILTGHTAPLAMNNGS
jgi:NADH dehydrogenase FAD-containing subunit